MWAIRDSFPGLCTKNHIYDLICNTSCLIYSVLSLSLCMLDHLGDEKLDCLEALSLACLLQIWIIIHILRGITAPSPVLTIIQSTTS